MSKISTYPLADSPLLLSDRLIGTEAFRTTPTPTPLATKNFSLGELLQLFSSNFPAPSLQAVLDIGNTATQNINLTGIIDVTLIKPDNIEDTSGSQGTIFQYLSKGTSSINWVDLPVDTLQDVLDAGNTATQNITLVGNITTTKIIPGNIQDDTAGIGTTGQLLSKTVSGIRWINTPIPTTPGLADVLSVGNTATNSITLIGDINATNAHITGAIYDSSNSPGTAGQILSSTVTGTDWIDSSSTITPSALTKVDDTNVTLTLGGTPATALLEGVSLTLGWSGTLADSRITSASYWNAKQEALSGTGLVKSVAGTISYITDNSTNWDTAYNDRITSLTTTGTGAATLISNVLNIPTPPTATFTSLTVFGSSGASTLIAGVLNVPEYTLAGLGGQPQLNGTGFVKVSGTTVSYDNSTYYLASNPNGFITSAALTGYVQNTRTLTINGTAYDLSADRAWSVGTVTSVSATSPITSSGGATPTISTSMDTNKLIGRSTAGTGVMEEIAIGTGLTLSAGTLSNANSGTVTSVGLTMPAAFTVSNSPITGAGTIAVTGAGTASQYIRGDGALATYNPGGGGGGGASVSYYLNGSVSQGTIGGVVYEEMNRVPVIGAGTNFTINANGYIAQFITDAGDPNKLLIPGGNWNFETYFSASSGGGSPSFYVELYKYDGTTFTLIASSSASPELITGGTNIDLYFTALAIPATTLLVTDRLAVRFYVTHSGRTITMHTEDNNLCQVITTFSTGLTALNGLTAQVQNFATGTSGSDFNISSITDTHTFNLPTASASNRGALSTTDWSAFNGKQNTITLTTTGSSGSSTFISNTLNIPTYTLSGLGGVPYTGATADLNLGTRDIYAKYAHLDELYLTDSSTPDVGFIYLDAETLYIKMNNADLLASIAPGRLNLLGYGAGGIYHRAIITYQTLTAGRTYALPNASGTIALTSDIPSLTGYVQTTRTISTTSPLQGGGDLSANRTLSILQSSGSQDGYLSSTDWTAFNGKFTLPSLTSGSVLFSNGSTIAQDNANFFWDDTNNRLGIGTSSPAYKLDVNGAINTNSFYRIGDVTTIGGIGSANAIFGIGGNDWVFYNPNATSNIFYTSGSERMRIDAVGNVGIGTSSPTAIGGNITTLDIKGVGGGGIRSGVAGGSESTFYTIAAGGYLGTISNIPLNLQTNNSVKATILANGDVGIGTTSPQAKLHSNSDILTGYFQNGTNVIYDALKLTNNTASNTLSGNGARIQFYNNSNNGTNLLGGSIRSVNVDYGWASDLVLSSVQNNGYASQTVNDAIWIKSSGNVGIATTSPLVKLQVQDPSNTFSSHFSGNNQTNGIAIGTNSSNVATIQGYTKTFSSINNIAINPDGGNVGIGTASPSAKLDVTDTSAGNIVNNITVQNASNTVGTEAGVFFAPTTATGNIRGARITGIQEDGNNTIGLKFYTGLGASITEKMRITSTGNVGIGTSSPGVRFVNSGGNWSSGPTLGSGTVGSQALLERDGNYGMYSGVDYTTGDVWHQVQRNDGIAVAYNLALQPSGGNIYIGTNAPIYSTPAKLQILFNGLSEYGLNFKTNASAAIPISFIDNASFQIGRIYYDATGTYYQTFSDYRLKEDLKPINGLELVSKMKVYDYKIKSCEKRSYGVLAHELQEVVPQIVFGEKDGKEMQGIDYSKLVPILIQAIQDQQKQIDELKKIIK